VAEFRKNIGKTTFKGGSGEAVTAEKGLQRVMTKKGRQVALSSVFGKNWKNRVTLTPSFADLVTPTL